MQINVYFGVICFLFPYDLIHNDFISHIFIISLRLDFYSVNWKFLLTGRCSKFSFLMSK